MPCDNLNCCYIRCCDSHDVAGSPTTVTTAPAAVARSNDESGQSVAPESARRRERVRASWTDRAGSHLLVSVCSMGSRDSRRNGCLCPVAAKIQSTASPRRCESNSMRSSDRWPCSTPRSAWLRSSDAGSVRSSRSCAQVVAMVGSAVLVDTSKPLCLM